jgi:hypothetical protein
VKGILAGKEKKIVEEGEEPVPVKQLNVPGELNRTTNRSGNLEIHQNVSGGSLTMIAMSFE